MTRSENATKEDDQETDGNEWEDLTLMLWREGEGVGVVLAL
jgi:hypothetical protein